MLLREYKAVSLDTDYDQSHELMVRRLKNGVTNRDEKLMLDCDVNRIRQSLQKQCNAFPISGITGV
jgi:hypothetical protein